ncbi:MAG: hypothetical protein ABSF59_08280 [Candidatus Sulfotelmatobacter sp.]
MSIKLVVRPFAAMLSVGYLFFTLAISSAAQTQPSNSDASTGQTSGTPGEIVPAPTQKNKDAQASSNQGTVEGTSKDRLFFALPNFLTLENAGQVPPLTTGQKFKVVFRGSFDYIQVPWYGFLSGISQAENSEPGYGQGAEGYAKRFGAAFADGTIENFMVGAVFPSILRQDPRYFQLGKGSFRHRTYYAISRSFVTRTDSGREQFNYSEILGGMLSAAISTNTYHPRAFITTRFDPATNMLTYVHNDSDRTLPNTTKVWGTQLGYDTLTLVVKEFWPDIHRRISKKRSQGESSPSANPHP